MRILVLLDVDKGLLFLRIHSNPSTRKVVISLKENPINNPNVPPIAPINQVKSIMRYSSSTAVLVETKYKLYFRENLTSSEMGRRNVDLPVN